MIFYELKISYTRQTGEDNPKAVKETYLVEGLTAADVEARLLGEIQKYISGEWETKSCKQVQFYDLIPNPEGDRWYKARVEMITIEDNGKEKRKNSVKLFFICICTFCRKDCTTMMSVYHKIRTHLIFFSCYYFQ